MSKSWHIPRTLSYEALRLLTELPMEEIERRLRLEPAAVEEQPSDQEVAELVAALRMDAECFAAEQPDLMQLTDKQLIRAAALLERQSLRPIPVSERLPGPEDCNAQGRCWFGTYASDVLEANWVFRKLAHQRHWDTHWLPANALPLPEHPPLPEDQS